MGKKLNFVQDSKNNTVFLLISHIMILFLNERDDLYCPSRYF